MSLAASINYSSLQLDMSRSSPLLARAHLLMFRYRVAIPLDSVTRSLGFTGPEARSDWHNFSAHMGLSYTDTHRDKLDCKTSMAALPLQQKPAEK